MTGDDAVTRKVTEGSRSPQAPGTLRAMNRPTLTLFATAALTVSVCSLDARAEDNVPVSDVLAMMGTVPAAPGDPKSAAFRWDRTPGADRVARAISATAPDREWAARMVVYAVHESGLKTECVTGDGGESHGTFQLKGVPEAVACDPMLAAPVWLAKAQKSMEDCSALPAYERMAELASGSCAHGHVLARWRETLVLTALARTAPTPPRASPSIE